MTMLMDRRRRRSDNRTQAMRLQLDACREDARFDAMVVSDDQGLCIASSGSQRASEEVAARLPLIGRDMDYYEGTLEAPEGSWEIAMRKVSIGGGALFVCAVGGKTPTRPLHLIRSMSGVSRILSTGDEPAARARV